MLKLETQLREEREENKILDKWTPSSKKDHEKHIMEKRIYKEDMENEVREMRRGNSQRSYREC